MLKRRYGIALLLILFSSGALLRAQQPGTPALHTYRSPDGSLSFQYSDALVLCQQPPKEEGSWKPDACLAYMPICPSQDSTGIIACLAVKPGPADKNTTFDGAAFSVLDLGPAKNEAACLNAAWHGSSGDWPVKKKINGADFRVTEIDGAAAGHWTDGHAYRTLHRGRCYELDSIITGIDGQDTDPPTKNFDKGPVKKAIDLPLSTFKFLK